MNFIKIVLICIALICLFVWLATFIPFINDLYERFLSAGEDGETKSRFEFWALCLDRFLSHSIFGIGFYGFRFEYHEELYVRSMVNDYPYLDAHNVYLQLLCETGLIGVGLFLYNSVKIIKCTFKELTDNTIRNSGLFPVVIFSTIMQIFFYLYWVTGNGLYDMMFSYFTIAVGFIIGIYIQNDSALKRLNILN